MRKLLKFLLVSLFCGCTAMPSVPTPLSDQHPKVIDLTPSVERLLDTSPELTLTFSKEIDVNSLGPQSLFFTQGSLDTNSYAKTSDLYKAIDKGTLTGVSFTITTKEGGKVLSLRPNQTLNPETTYTLVVTPRVLSRDHVPLNQNSQAEMEPFTALYTTTNASTSTGSPLSPAGSSNNSLSTVVEGTVVLNEIFYDSTDSDTDGVLFVELYGTPDLNIGNYKINFINGSNGSFSDSITLSANAQIPSDGFYLIADTKTGSSTGSYVALPDLVDNFDPQNGPDAVQLVDDTGNLLDAVGYGEDIAALAENGLATFEETPTLDVASGHSLERQTPGFDTDDNSADFRELDTPTPGYAIVDMPASQDLEDEESEPVEEDITEENTSPEPPAKIVINEIYYDAIGSDMDGVVFVELYGTPEASIEGMTLNFVNGDDGVIYDNITLPPVSTIGTDGFYLIADTNTGSTTSSHIDGYDLLNNFDPQNGPDAVQLLDSTGQLLDALSYGDVLVTTASNGLAIFEASAAPGVINGHSLERQTPGLDTDNNLSDFTDRAVPTPGQ